MIVIRSLLFFFKLFGIRNSRINFAVVGMPANKFLSNMIYSSYITKINNDRKVTFHCHSLCSSTWESKIRGLWMLLGWLMSWKNREKLIQN